MSFVSSKRRLSPINTGAMIVLEESVAADSDVNSSCSLLSSARAAVRSIVIFLAPVVVVVDG